MKHHIVKRGFGLEIFEDILFFHQRIKFKFGDFFLFLWVNNTLHHLLLKVKRTAHTPEHIEDLFIVNDPFGNQPRTIFEQRTVLDLFVLIETDEFDERIHITKLSLSAAILLFEQCQKNALLLLVKPFFFEKLFNDNGGFGHLDTFFNPFGQQRQLVFEPSDTKRIVCKSLLIGSNLMQEADHVELILQIFQMVGVGFDLRQ